EQRGGAVQCAAVVGRIPTRIAAAGDRRPEPALAAGGVDRVERVLGKARGSREEAGDEDRRGEREPAHGVTTADAWWAGERGFARIASRPHPRASGVARV